MKQTDLRRKSIKDKLKKKWARLFYEPTRLALVSRYLRTLGSSNAVFIWIPKSAGTSVLSALQTCGCSKLKKIHFVKYYFPQKGMVSFGHMHYPRLIDRGYVSKNFDQSAYKFCFSRNPYDRAVSLLFYLRKINRIPQTMSFLEFCRQLRDKGCENIGLYHLNGWSHCNPQVRWIENIEMDFIGKFEDLETDFNKILKDLNLPAIKLPHYNPTNHKPYSSYYCEETLKIIQSFYEEDFQLFGYDRHLL